MNFAFRRIASYHFHVPHIYFLSNKIISKILSFFCPWHTTSKMVPLLILYQLAKTTSIRLYILCKIFSVDWKCSGHKILCTPQRKATHAKVSQFKIFPPNTTAIRREECIYLHIGRTIKDSLHIWLHIIYLNVSLYVHNIDRLLRTYAHLLLPKLPPFQTFYAGVFYRSTTLRRYPFIPSYLSYVVYVAVCIVKLLFLNYLELLRVVSWCGIIHKPKFTKTLID